MEPGAYSGDEDAVEWSAGARPPGGSDVFEVRPARVPPGAASVVDEASGAGIGYREDSGGVWMVWDLDGALVEIGELPLEAPLLDPIDLLSGGLTGLLRGALRGAARGAAGGAIAGAGRAGVRALATRTVLALHRVFRGLIGPGSLKFTATTATRMATPGRHVPLHILRLAIRHGKQMADPQGVLGAVKYVAPMWRNGKQYTLEVIVRARDSTVLHFHYE